MKERIGNKKKLEKWSCWDTVKRKKKDIYVMMLNDKPCGLFTDLLSWYQNNRNVFNEKWPFFSAIRIVGVLKKEHRSYYYYYYWLVNTINEKIDIMIFFSFIHSFIQSIIYSIQILCILFFTWSSMYKHIYNKHHYTNENSLLIYIW